MSSSTVESQDGRECEEVGVSADVTTRLPGRSGLAWIKAVRSRRAAVSRARKRRRGGLARAQARTGWMLVLPSAIFVALFQIIPIIVMFYLSFTNYCGFRPPEWVGLNNYTRLIHSRDFATAIRNTAYYAAGYVIPNIVVALGLALLLNQRVKAVGLFRSIFFVPVIVSTTSISLMALWVFEPRFGLINYSLSLLHLPRQGWLFDRHLAMPTIIAICIWQYVGYNVVYFLAGLQDIPQELYDAAAIDGGGKWAQFRYVTLPLLAHTTFYAFLTTTIYAFQVFVPILVLTGGGPGRNTTSSLVLTIYEYAFNNFKLGQASAMAVVLFLFIMVLTVVNFRYLSPEEIY